MKGNGWRSSVGNFLSRFFPPTKNGGFAALREEIERLHHELRAERRGNLDSMKLELDMIRRELLADDLERLAPLRQEMELLRNEILENIAAIHRLEILTLGRRIELLSDFGKVFPPSNPGKTRKSSKPRGYSFGIITNGKRNEKLMRLVDTIRAQKLASHRYEIMIAGCVDAIKASEGLRTVPMEKAAAEGRLGAMRNVLAKSAHFNKLVSLDDDLLLHSGWAEAVEEVNEDFDLATGIIVNPDLTRYCDWVNNVDNYTFLRPYHERFDKCQYLTGGYGIYKDYVFENNAWHDHLGFYQGEDVTFSRKLFDSGFQLKFIAKAVVMHDDERYSQKGYGVIRCKSPGERAADTDSEMTLRLEKLCPRTIS